MIAYTTYLTWSALSHEPDDLCNPPGYVISGYDQTTGLSMQGIVSGVFVFIMLIYVSFSTAMSASKLSKFTRHHECTSAKNWALEGAVVSSLDSGLSCPASSPGRKHIVVFLGKTLTLINGYR